MAQQINLYDDALRPRRVAFGASHALAAAGTTLALTGVLAVVLGQLAQHSQQRAQAATTATAPLQQQVLAAAQAASATAPDQVQGEITRLRRFEAAQQRVAGLLDGGTLGSRQGPSETFLALARQAHPSLWITGVTLSDDGRHLDLEGRMTDAGVLPDYLRRLQREPLFQQRAFAQLRLAAVEPAAGAVAALPYTEFTLRSLPGGGPASPQR